MSLSLCHPFSSSSFCSVVRPLGDGQGLNDNYSCMSWQKLYGNEPCRHDTRHTIVGQSFQNITLSRFTTSSRARAREQFQKATPDRSIVTRIINKHTPDNSPRSTVRISSSPTWLAPFGDCELMPRKRSASANQPNKFLFFVESDPLARLPPGWGGCRQKTAISVCLRDFYNAVLSALALLVFTFCRRGQFVSNCCAPRRWFSMTRVRIR